MRGTFAVQNGLALAEVVQGRDKPQGARQDAGLDQEAGVTLKEGLRGCGPYACGGVSFTISVMNIK